MNELEKIRELTEFYDSDDLGSAIVCMADRKHNVYEFVDFLYYNVTHDYRRTEYLPDLKVYMDLYERLTDSK